MSSLAAMALPIHRCCVEAVEASDLASCSGRFAHRSSKWRRGRGGAAAAAAHRGTKQRLLCSSMLDTWRDSRDASRVLWHAVWDISTGQGHVPVVVDEIAGQYEDSYEDVDKHLMDYFTFKAVRTVLAQLYEMNPSQYIWFYNFVGNNKPQDSKVFIRLLVKERQELAERVMVTRLHLFGKWVKKYSHENMYNAISDQNLELLRERLMQTVKLPSDGEEFTKT
ncbi:chaperonin-like RbcX protein 2, chloroplastic [Selaginella moellendorffii]|uniref:chaperonin-like RbcX protein 2, chloroplastic n=1 Tax=Selaginella moellendorffii TaxID=88036 RepID=UPI000D1C65E8|nr:chaperonin-like RbcX protein 2, chloroplastic [Selaginella moellendorffii]|eukprot:XP_024524194.1 chaperonin-like RbcX protein 2, chloroplastic [Selaginella moellendorffii]